MSTPESIAGVIKNMALFNFNALSTKEADITIVKKANTDITKDSVFKVSVNIEKLPIAFLGSPSEKAKLENELRQTKLGRWEIIKIENNQGVVALSVAPSSSFGLMSGFDMDVLTIIEYKLHQLKHEQGGCPSKVRLWLSDFPKIMGEKKNGLLYQKIRESVMRISETTIYQDRLLHYKATKSSAKQKIGNRAIKFLVYRESEHTIDTEKKAELNRSFVDVEIEDWMREDINNNYTTELDIKTYFSIKSDRSRYLYRILELIRFKPRVRISLEKLERDMYLKSIQASRFRKRAIVRAIEDLVSNQVVKKFDIDESFLYVDFYKVKSKENLDFLKPNELALDQERTQLLKDLIEKLDDQNSKAWFIKILGAVPVDIVRGCLSIALEAEKMNTVIKSKGAVFTHNLTEICNKRGIALPYSIKS